MARRLEFFVSPDGKAETIYSDEAAAVLRERNMRFEVDRFSHVEPIASPRWWEWLFLWQWRQLQAKRRFVARNGTGYFGIIWKGPMRKRGVELTNHGRPFRNRAEALAYEEAVIRAEYFHVRQ